MSADEQHSPLQQALAEIERHVRDGGWDQPARLYALAPTGELLAREPALAERIGITGEPGPDTLTPIEQDVPNRPIEDLLATITWPETVAGCALVMERIVLPPGAEDEMPEDEAAATTWAQQHPARSDVRVVVGVMRDGRRESVMRVRGHEADNELIRGAELSPELGNALAETFR